MISNPPTDTVQVTGLDTKLNDPTARMTVFVPINSAFDVLAQQLNSSVPALLTQTDMLAQVYTSNEPPFCSGGPFHMGKASRVKMI